MKRAEITEKRVFGTALDRLTGGDETKVRPVERQSAEESRAATMIKLSVFLNREEDGYLERLASAAKFSGGKKISKTRLIQTMVRAFSKTGLDVSGVGDDEELYRRVIAQLR